MQGPEKPIHGKIERVAQECIEAGATKWDVLKIIKELSERGSTSLSEMRNVALEMLRKLNPEAAEVYYSFQKMLVYTSKETIEAFDRGNIIKSLLKETNVSRAIAEKIGREVEDQIKDLRISQITTALIRTMVNVKLLEYGHENIYKQYARLGLPVFEIENALKRNERLSKEVLRPYNLLIALPKNASELHFSGRIFVGALQDYSSKAYAFSFAPKIKANSAGEMLMNILMEMKQLEKNFSLPINMDSLNFLLVGGFANAGKPKINSFAKLCVGALNKFYGPQLQEYAKPSIGLDLYTETNFEQYDKYSNSAIEFALRVIEHYKNSKRNFNLKIFVDSKFRLKLLEDKHFYTGLYFVNCKTERVYGLNGGLLSRRRGVLQLTGINLPLIAHQSSKQRDFIANTENIAVAINNAFSKKQKLLAGKIEEIESFANMLGKYCTGHAIREIAAKENIDRNKLEEKIVEALKEKVVDGAEIASYEGMTGIKKFEEISGKFIDAGLENEKNYFVAKSREELAEQIEKNKCVKLEL